MSEHHPSGDPDQLAALYVTGAMTVEERADFEQHLATGCAACLDELAALDQTLEALSSVITPITPPAFVREQLLRRAERETPALVAAAPASPQVWRDWQPDRWRGDLFVKRAAEGQWEDTGVPGVAIRRLFVDHDRSQFTALVRMSPGSAYPRHVHNGPEECLVLEGDLHIGDEDVLHAGDYQRAAPGSKHAVQHTQAGCLLLITSSLDDELI